MLYLLIRRNGLSTMVDALDFESEVLGSILDRYVLHRISMDQALYDD